MTNRNNHNSFLIGKTVYWDEPWNDGPEMLFDHEGEPITRVRGNWEIVSVNDSNAWLSMEFEGHDFQIEVPLDSLPMELWD